MGFLYTLVGIPMAIFGSGHLRILESSIPSDQFCSVF